MTLSAGRRLGAYEIVASIGKGAMGEVFRAKDLKLGRHVAVKVLIEGLAADRDRLRRFEQEARAASALNHPNIVHIYDIGEENGTHYMVMELVEGDNLRQLLADAPFDNERVLDLSRQIAAGLANAHAAGIVHRDVKPENVMVTADGFVKILDFGLAKLLDTPFEMHSEMVTLARLGTRHGMLIGTVEYMSPEQAAGKAVDRRSDQFSFGLIVYEMATGRMAFRRETAAQTLASIIETEPRPIAELNPESPERLARVVRRCLKKAPEERYGDTEELLRDLKAVSTREAIEPSPPPAPPPIPPVPQNPVPGSPSFGAGVRALVGREVSDAFAEAGRELAESSHPRTYLIQTDRGATKTISEERLRKRLRGGRLSGDELVRLEGESEWIPLHESAIFRREVPVRGERDDWRRRRSVGAYLQHLLAFAGVGAGWLVVVGEVPSWMAFWSIGVAAHTAITIPDAVLLWHRRRKALPLEEPANAKTAIPALEDDASTRSFRDEVARVKELLEARSGEGAESLVEEIGRIEERVTALASKRRALDEQTSSSERERLAAAIADAERKLGEATAAGDRGLYRRQLEVLHERRAAIDKALVVIDRAAVRQDVAEQQIKQLRLDLLRAEASSASVPELTSRLQDIRHEVDAVEKVDEAIARELSS